MSWNNCVCMENQCQIILIKLCVWTIHELETFGTRQRILRKKSWRDVAVPESIQSCFEPPTHFPVFFSCKLFLIAVHSWFAGKDLQTNVWKCQNATRCFLAQLHSPVNFCKILYLVPKVSNSWIFQKRCFMKIIWHRISIQTLLFQDVFAYQSRWLPNP